MVTLIILNIEKSINKEHLKQKSRSYDHRLDIFICKQNASKLAKMFKEVMTGNDELVNIMTDMTGQNKAMMASKHETQRFTSKAGKVQTGYRGHEKNDWKSAGDMVSHLGSREIYRCLVT